MNEKGDSMAELTAASVCHVMNSDMFFLLLLLPHVMVPCFGFMFEVCFWCEERMDEKMMDEEKRMSLRA